MSLTNRANPVEEGGGPVAKTGFITDGTVAATFKFKAQSFSGNIDRVLNLTQVKGVVGVSDAVTITVIHKGTKLAEATELPGKKIKLTVIDHTDSAIAAAAADAAAAGGIPETLCPSWLQRWIPTPVRSVVAYTASFVPAWATGAHTAEAAAVGSDTAPMQARRGEIVPITVDFTPDSETADEIVITWSADGCGELLHETTQVFPAKVGEKLVTEQSLRASGTGGLVVCRIADDVSSDTREFRFV